LLNGQHRLTQFGPTESAKSWPSPAGTSAGIHPSPVAERDIKRHKWKPLLFALVIACALMLGWTLIRTDHPLEIAQHGYRSAAGEIHRLTGLQDDKTEAAAQKDAEKKGPAADARPRNAAEGMPKSEARGGEQRTTAQADLKLSEHNREIALGTARAYFSPHTQAMIVAWQRKQNLPETGLLDENQVVALLEQAMLADRLDEMKVDARRYAELAETELNLAEQDRKRVQLALNSLGYRISTSSGHFDSHTRSMIKAWQNSQGLHATGYLSEPQLEALWQQSAATLGKYEPAVRKGEDRHGN